MSFISYLLFITYATASSLLKVLFVSISIFIAKAAAKYPFTQKMKTGFFSGLFILSITCSAIAYKLISSISLLKFWTWKCVQSNSDSSESNFWGVKWYILLIPSIFSCMLSLPKTLVRFPMYTWSFFISEGNLLYEMTACISFWHGFGTHMSGYFFSKSVKSFI